MKPRACQVVSKATAYRGAAGPCEARRGLRPSDLDLEVVILCSTHRAVAERGGRVALQARAAAEPLRAG